MNLFVEQTGSFGSNCYMLSTSTAAVVIDIGEFTTPVRQFLEENRGKETLLLATHRHFDHVAGMKEAKDFCGAKTAVHVLDECGFQSAADSMGANFDIVHPSFSADVLLSDGDMLTVGDIEIGVMHTPGHTEGSVCFVIDDMIFSGDTLFFLSVGRTDFPTGNTAVLLKSLEKLFSLPRDYKVFPGHERPTTLFYERENNPYYRGKR